MSFVQRCAAVVASFSALSQAFAQKPCRPFPENPLYLQNENPLVQEGDFNSDGILDLVAFTANGVTVLLGKGDGTFRVAGTFPPGETNLGAGFTVGDFNSDGKLDVAVTLANGTVNVLLGNGNGAFQNPKTSSISTFTGFLRAGDFNHDGKLDLASIPLDQFGPSVIQVLLGNGDGTFQPPVDYFAGQVSSQLAIADFNGDSNLDLAVANGGTAEMPGRTVSILLGNGDGTFQPQAKYEVGRQPFGIATADFNGDGHVDIATANYFDGTVSVLFGKGDGTFQNSGTYPVGHPESPYGIASVVFTRGQKPGIAVATLAGVYTLTNKGDGTMYPAQGFGPGALQLVTGDFNGDGHADLALSAGDYDLGSGVAVLLGLGKGIFATSTAFIAIPNSNGLAAGDFNGDGVMDLAIGELDGPDYAIMLGLGHGRFAKPEVYYELPDGLTGVAALAAGDLNGDGKPDLVIAGDGPWEAVTLFGVGDGTFTTGAAYPLAGEWPNAISLVDLNGDGKLDMAVVSAGNYESQGALSVLLNNGDGTFQKAVGYAVDAGAAEVIGPAIADFNGDGVPDIAIADNDSSTLVMLLGNGDGTFHTGPITPLTAAVSAIAASDFNRDGKPDLALLTETPGIEILSGDGNGSFTPGDSFPAQSGYWLTAADLNGDGKADLAVLSGQGLVQVFEGKGDGTFGFGTTTYTGIDPGLRNLVLADLNGDGSPDLAAPNYDSATVSVLLNRCPTR